MIRFLSLFVFLGLFFVMPVKAQENTPKNADDVLSEKIEPEPEQKQEQNAPIKAIDADDNYEARLTLARKMHEIWPIRPKIESALDNITAQIPETERLKFKAAMRQAIKFDALEEASIDAMADVFSEKELSAMIAFYGSKEGRSVSHKTSDYERALEPVMVKMIDKALLDVKLGKE